MQLENLVARLQPDVSLLHRNEMLPDVFFFLNVINIFIVKFLSNIVLLFVWILLIILMDRDSQ